MSQFAVLKALSGAPFCTKQSISSSITYSVENATRLCGSFRFYSTIAMPWLFKKASQPKRAFDHTVASRPFSWLRYILLLKSYGNITVTTLKCIILTLWMSQVCPNRVRTMRSSIIAIASSVYMSS